MLYISHRINTVAQLAQVPAEHGIEVDLRDSGDRLILQHDPFKDGEDFETFMHSFCQPELVVTPEREEGVFFMGGKKDFAALHSEPPVHEKRLFFSLIPCSEQQLIELKPKVMILFPKGLKKNNLNNSAAPNPRG